MKSEYRGISPRLLAQEPACRPNCKHSPAIGNHIHKLLGGRNARTESAKKLRFAFEGENG